jgi:hypothetical protein
MAYYASERGRVPWSSSSSFSRGPGGLPTSALQRLHSVAKRQSEGFQNMVEQEEFWLYLSRLRAWRADPDGSPCSNGAAVLELLVREIRSDQGLRESYGWSAVMSFSQYITPYEGPLALPTLVRVKELRSAVCPRWRQQQQHQRQLQFEEDDDFALESASASGAAARVAAEGLEEYKRRLSLISDEYREFYQRMQTEDKREQLVVESKEEEPLVEPLADLFKYMGLEAEVTSTARLEELARRRREEEMAKKYKALIGELRAVIVVRMRRGSGVA